MESSPTLFSTADCCPASFTPKVTERRAHIPKYSRTGLLLTVALLRRRADSLKQALSLAAEGKHAQARDYFNAVVVLKTEMS
jgi:hypothetical protein